MRIVLERCHTRKIEPRINWNTFIPTIFLININMTYWWNKVDWKMKWSCEALCHYIILMNKLSYLGLKIFGLHSPKWNTPNLLLSNLNLNGRLLNSVHSIWDTLFSLDQWPKAFYSLIFSNMTLNSNIKIKRYKKPKRAKIIMLN